MTDKNIGIFEALQIALDAEKKAYEFYNNSVAKVSSGKGKNLLQQLARFEQSHYNKLNELKESLQGGKYIKYEGTEFSAYKTGTAGEIESNKDDALHILSEAIKAEEKANEHYKNMAEITDDPDGKDMFLRLADEETLHRRILSDEFYQLSNQGGIWFWGD